MKRFIILLSVLLVLFITRCCYVIRHGSAEAMEAPEQEMQVANIYPALMVIPEIETQAAEFAKITLNYIKEEAIEKEEKEEKASAQKEENKTTNNESSGNTAAIITHYCACSKCNGKWSYTENGLNCTKTASGIVLYDGISGNYCAATFGSLGDTILINGTEYIIADRMGGNDGYRIDIFVAGGHDRCNELGRYTAEVILES